MNAELDAAENIIGHLACEGLTVERLAEALVVSRRSLELAFRRKLGISPGKAIQQARLLESQKLLGETTLPITEVAARVGYADHAAFTKFVRRNLGVSPLEYRATRRRKSPK